VPQLNEREIAEALATRREWSRDGDVLVRAVKRRGWRDAIALVNAVAEEADRRDHHPDICVTGYRTVTFRLTTHSEGGITQRDVDLARRIDELAAGED
jgi:4a-hydroxytetrahydrobiopterin dehydratase